MPVCLCVLVSGLKDDTTDDTLQLYFENKRSGGNAVSKVERETRNSALVYFEDISSKRTLSFVYQIYSPSYKLLVFSHRSLIKNIKQTAVINILKTRLL